jgi:hypothetical protein
VALDGLDSDPSAGIPDADRALVGPRDNVCVVWQKRDHQEPREVAMEGLDKTSAGIIDADRRIVRSRDDARAI